jgi:outer membrane protein OmpA-like peptidoglycan-associated protein
MADLQAKKTERGMIITIGDVLFGTDQARLTPDGMNTVRKLADVLNQNPNRTVLVEGFTDSTGTSAHNQELSERRAAAVASALTGMGIARERVAMRGYGRSYPVAGNDSAGNRQLNRRVEIVLSNEGAAIPPRR